jgi:hypothetical protein
MLKRVEQDYSREIREVQSYMVPHLKHPVDAYHVLKLRVCTVQLTYLVSSCVIEFVSS